MPLILFSIFYVWWWLEILISSYKMFPYHQLRSISICAIKKPPNRGIVVSSFCISRGPSVETLSVCSEKHSSLLYAVALKTKNSFTIERNLIEIIPRPVSVWISNEVKVWVRISYGWVSWEDLLVQQLLVSYPASYLCMYTSWNGLRGVYILWSQCALQRLEHLSRK